MSMFGSSFKFYSNPDPDTIFFAIKSEGYSSTFGKLKQDNNNNNQPNFQKLFLMSELCNFPLFEVIPKDFSISTKNSTCHFNKIFLKNTSAVISELLENKPTENSYFLNTDDEENVLHKFEQLYLGESVVFDEDELPYSQKITKLLKIKNCPNLLKPKSLKYNKDIYVEGLNVYNYNRGICSNENKITVIICLKWLIEYLKKEKELLTFSISTKKKEYKCNIFGVYSSNVLRKILENDPSITSFNYDFDDESDEFQLIVDLFNFKQVDITNKNMNFLKKIAENLQIDCVINQINNFISSYEKITAKVKEQKIIINPINNLFDLLYNIKKYGIQKVKESIIQSNWIQKVDSVKELAAFIIQVIKCSFSLQKEMADLLVQLNEEANESNKLNELIPFIVKILMQNYFKDKKIFLNEKFSLDYLTDIEKADNRYAIHFIYILYKKGIIPKEQIIEKLKNNVFKNKYLYAFFLSELIESNSQVFNNELNYIFSRNDNIMKSLKKYLPDKIDQYTKLMENMEPDDELTKSLRKDDVVKLQTIIETEEIDVTDALVPYNIFDDFPISITLINYAAYCGSIECFKYLLSNNAKIDKSTMYFAVYGNNSEIIKIVDSTKIEDTDLAKTRKKSKYSFSSSFHKSFTNPHKEEYSIYTKYINGLTFNCINYSNYNAIISSAITMHRNELFDWIFENKFVNKGKLGNELNEIAMVSAVNGNAHSLIEIINKGFCINMDVILQSAKNGFYQLSVLLLSMINRKETIDSNQSAFFGNLSIFELFFNEMKKNSLHDSIYHAIEMDYKDIIDYFFDKASHSITNSFVVESLIESLKKNKLFDFLMAKFKELKPNAFKSDSLKKLLSNACINTNLHATKIITDIILLKNPDYDFCDEFIDATKSNEICRYFIDKKVNLNYEQLSLSPSNLASLDLDLFLIILERVSQTNKYNLLKSAKHAIQKKNKKLIEFLLNKKAPKHTELIEAVFTSDLDIVDFILKYNKDPSFINYDRGEALITASINKDLNIVKRLLSLPGIDPTYFDINGDTVLSAAIKSDSSEIVDEIVKFFGNDENVQKNISFFYYSILSLSRNNESYNNINLQPIIRLFETTSIDPNYFELNTFLCIACQDDDIEAVERFLKLKNIDVNKCDTRDFNTPLMIAIQKKNVKMAKLLIQHPKTNLNLRNLYDETAITIAISKNLKGVADLIVKDKRFDPIESNFNFGFFNANFEMMRHLSTLSFINVNYTYEYTFKHQNHEKTALVHSVLINDIDKLDFIINHPSFDKDKSNIKEAIFTAAEKNNINIFRKLIKLYNNDINISNNKGKSLLSAASFYLSGEIVNEILNNPQFDAKKSQIWDAFVQSYSYESDKMYFFMVAPWIKKWKNHNKSFGEPRKDNQPNWEKKPSLEDNPIWQMKDDALNTESLPPKSTMIEIMNILYNYDKEHSHLINFKELLPNGKSFFSSIYADYTEIDKVCQFLLDHGVDPNKKDKKGIYPLLTAIGVKSVKFVDTLLINATIDFSQIGDRTTYLHVAAGYSDNNIVQSLINTKAFDINAKDINGDTPLIIACKARKGSIVELLLKQDDIDYLHCNNEGVDALNTIKKISPSENNEARKSKKDYENHLRINSTGNSTWGSPSSSSTLNINDVFTFKNQSEDD